MTKQEELWISYFGEYSIGVWRNKDFMAVAFQEPNCIRLDIKRNDDKDGITWDELQKIKNECGFEDKDAIEFYPAEKDVINNGNFRHIYIFDDKLPLIRRI